MQKKKKKKQQQQQQQQQKTKSKYKSVISCDKKKRDGFEWKIKETLVLRGWCWSCRRYFFQATVTMSDMVFDQRQLYLSGFWY